VCREEQASGFLFLSNHISRTTPHDLYPSQKAYATYTMDVSGIGYFWMANPSTNPRFPFFTALATLLLLGLFAGLSYWVVKQSPYQNPSFKQEAPKQESQSP